MGLIGIAIDGAQKAAQKLQKLGTDLLEAERRAVGKAAIKMTARSKRLASGIVINVKSGALHDSIDFQGPFRDAEGWYSPVGVRRGNAEKYAPLHEFGGDVQRVSSLTRRAGPGKPFTAHYRARRYIGIAFDEIRPVVPKILSEEIQKAVDRANG